MTWVTLANLWLMKYIQFKHYVSFPSYIREHFDELLHERRDYRALAME